MFHFLLLQTDWALFIGRFHPVFVHLPIGFLLLAGLLEYFGRRRKTQTWDGAVSLSLLLGAAGGILAIICGLALAAEGGYEDDSLFWHKWLGIGTTILAAFAWLIKTNRINLSGKSLLGVWIATLLGVAYTGHLGGNLTHGEGYLFQYAPSFIQTLAGHKVDTTDFMNFPPPDSILIFADLVQPVLEKKCVTCHNDSKTQGGLNMSSFSKLIEGGDHGSVIEEGAALSSELVRRVTINPTSVKYMPTKGIPMTFTEISLLSWWIDEGADSSLHLLETEVPDHIKALLLRDYKLDTRPRPYVETASTVAMPAEIKSELEESGFSVTLLAANSNFVEISPNVVQGQVDREQVKKLVKAKDQITWLNFGGTGLKDEDLSHIGQLEQLTRLRLEKNEITDEGVKHLAGLVHLESLNLYGTEVTDASLQHIAKLPALKKVYLWQTQVTQEGVESLESQRPGLMIDTGFQFAQQMTTQE